MSDGFFFSHDYKARADKKLVRLQMRHGMEGIGIYWCIVEMLYEEGGYLPLSECEGIAYELRTQCERIESVLRDFDLFIVDGDIFYSKSVLARLEKRNVRTETARKSAYLRWNKASTMQTQCEPDANAMQTHTVCNANKEKNNTVENNTEEKYSAGFLLFWKSYPVKTGKGAAWKSWRRYKCEKHADRIIEAIERQSKWRDAQRKSGQFTPNWKNPATWINQECWEDDTETISYGGSNGKQKPEQPADHSPRSLEDMYK